MAPTTPAALLVIAILAAGSCYGAEPAQPIPRYLELARELVETVTPENNQYYEYMGAKGVRWKGDLVTSENTVRTACGGFVAAVFEKAGDPTLDKVKANMTVPLTREKDVRFRDWYAAAVGGWGLRRIENLNDVQPGDLFIFTCNDPCYTTAGVNAGGHIAIIDAKPEIVFSRKPLLDGTVQWKLTVIDSADLPHGPDDTRFAAKGQKKISGVGRGTYRVYTDRTGVPVGYAPGVSARYFPVVTRPILVSRPEH